MKRRSRSIVFVLIALTPLAFARPLRGQATDWKKIQAPPLHPFHPQQPRRVELANGMVIFLQEDHELPLIRGTARIRGGSQLEPADKIGLVDIYGQVWRTGGTKSQTGDQLDDYLEAHAAKVETDGGPDFTTATWDCLKDNFDDVFSVFVEILREPEFRGDKLPLAKNQMNTSISRRNDQPFAIAFREAAKLVYGADSPYARVPEYATVAAVTRDDLLNWHKTYVHPNNIILGVVGDFDSSKMEAKLREAFGSWPKGEAAPKIEASFNGPKPGIYFVPKDDVTASTVQMVDLGTRRDNPDYYAIDVFNEFFGGGFSSRLFSNIRSKKGLAYTVGGGIGTDFDHPAISRLFLGTKSKTTAAALDAFNAELDALKTNPATPEELTKAKEAILNSFVFRFDSKEKVLGERITYEFYGYPPDFLERYRVGIEKVTLDDVKRVADKYIHKNQFAVLVVGKASDFDRPLSSYGPVTTLDITIPQPGGGKAAGAAAGTNAEGKALLAKITEAMGGTAKINTIKSLRRKVSATVNTPQGEMAFQAEAVSVFPDRSWQKIMGTPMGDMVMVLTSQAAFMTSPQGSQDMPASMKEEALKDLLRDPLQVAQHGDDPTYVFSAGATEKVGDVEARILEVNAAGAEVRWYIDPQTGRILRAAWQGMGMGGPAATVADYADWKSVDGVFMPFKETRTQNGAKAMSVELTGVEFNPTIDPKIFEQPAGQEGGAKPN